MRILFQLLAACTLLAVASPRSGAEPPPQPSAVPARDIPIGANIAYRRIRSLPQDELPSTSARPGESIVVDLRFARGDQKAAGIFGAWVRARASEKTPVVILANGETAGFLIASIAATRLPPGAVTVGPKSDRFSPDIAVAVDEAADKAAYEALDRGAAIGELVTPRNDKPRRDEAAIMKDRAPKAPGIAAKSDPGRTEAPPVDPALQRGVQLLRALAALRKG